MLALQLLQVEIQRCTCRSIRSAQGDAKDSLRKQALKYASIQVRYHKCACREPVLGQCSKNTKPFPGCKVKGLHSNEILGEYHSNGQWIMQIYLSKSLIDGHPGSHFGKYRLKFIAHVVQFRALRCSGLSDLGTFLFC